MRMTSRATRAAIGVVAATVSIGAGCDTGAAPARNVPPWSPGEWPARVPPEAASVELGRLLFYDPILSSDRQTACATCHSEVWGMSDGLPRSIGVGGGLLTGPGREGPNVLERNAPSLWNVAFRESLFWDGRETLLERQVLSPMHSALELGREPAEVVADLAAIPAYVVRFEAAFGDAVEVDAEAGTGTVTVARLTRALADFMRSLISDRALYDGWVDGDDGALTPTMRRGMERFGALGCATCHVPPRFEVERYVDRSVGGDDTGRARFSGDERDRFAFRVPSLRNAQSTDPYFHDGSVARLEDAILHELRLSPQFDPTRVDEDLEALTAFVGRALVDTSREPTRPDEVPSGLELPIDGFRVPR